MRLKSKFHFTILAFLAVYGLISAPLYSQPNYLRDWEATYGGERLESISAVHQTADGFLLAGSSYDRGLDETYLYIVSTDSVGGRLWDLTLRGPGAPFAVWPAGTRGCLVVCGVSPEGWYHLVRLDEKGDTLWTRVPSGRATVRGLAAVQTYNGEIAVAGTDYLPGTTSHKVYLARLTPTGDTLWTKGYGDKNYDAGFALTQTKDYGFIVAGTRRTRATSPAQIYVIKTDGRGVIRWERIFGGDGHDQPAAVLSTDDGGCILAGTTTSYGAGEEDFFVLRLTEQGDSLWMKTFGTMHRDEAHAMIKVDDGYLLAGNTQPAGAAAGHGLLVQVTAWGDSVWSGGPGDAYADEIFCAEETQDGFIVAGERRFGSGSSDALLMHWKAAR